MVAHIQDDMRELIAYVMGPDKEAIVTARSTITPSDAIPRILVTLI